MSCLHWNNGKDGPERKSVWICDPWNSYLRTIEEACEQERLARERELRPGTEVQEPEIIEAALVEDWTNEIP